jgi:hypothetical protein
MSLRFPQPRTNQPKAFGAKKCLWRLLSNVPVKLAARPEINGIGEEKFILYKTLIRPEVTYGEEEWTLTEEEEQAVLIF